MSLSTLPKWLKIGLPIFLGVLVVGSILVFSTNPELFQGSLGRIEPIDIRQVSPTFDSGQSEEEPSLTFEDCQLLKQYQASGTLTDHLGNDLSSYQECQNSYPEYMDTWPSDSECKVLKQHLVDGDLTQTLKGDMNYAIYCANNVPNIWFDQYPDENYCELLKGYYEDGILTDMLNGDTSDAQFCADNFPNIWKFDDIESPYCKLLKQYAASGTLTDNLGSDLSPYQDCENKYPEYMHSWPSIPECKILKQHLANGDLTQTLNGDINHAIYCEGAFPTIWHGQNPDENYCWLLKAYFEGGILTDMLGGNTSDAQFCADNFPITWYGVDEPEQEPQPPQPEKPKIDEPEEFEFCEGFVDVPKYHQYYDAVQYMVDANIVDEHPSECKFRVNDNLNRAEASKLMVLGFNLVNPAVSAPHFPDVVEGEWYYDYVSTVFENNVMTGNPDGLFKPANTLNRAEMVKMVVVAHHGGNTLAVPAITPQAAQDTCPGLSQEELEGWYMPYFVNAKDIGIVPVNDPCRPADPATRGEVSQVFYFESLI